MAWFRSPEAVHCRCHRPFSPTQLPSGTGSHRIRVFDTPWTTLLLISLPLVFLYLTGLIRMNRLTNYDQS